MKNIIIEVAVQSYSECLLAIKNGANRVEIFENFPQGGTTPSYGTIKACVEKLKIPSVVMLRPRGGNFIYSNDELDILRYDIGVCNSIKPYRVILGALDNTFNINYSVMQELINLSKVDVAMHRAFDEVIEKYGINYALEQINKLSNIGIKSLLSAGGKGSALNQIDNLNKLLLECSKYNIELVVAGKITKNDLPIVLQKVPAIAFHGRDIAGSIFN